MAAKNTALGWPGSNGDLFKAVVKLLAKRHAQTRFVHIESKENNQAKREAYGLAKHATNILGPNTLFDVEIDFPSTLSCGNLHSTALSDSRRKVTTALEETSPVKPKPWATGEDAPEEERPQSHRGRAKVHALQFALRTELLACNSPKKFWDFVRKRTDPRPKKSKVSMTDLSADFEARLNFPKVPPASFNAEQLAFNARMAKDLRPPPDMSPRQSYTRDMTIKEIEEMKRHIKALNHGLDTAMGVDGFSYEDCLAIPNEKLLEFFLYCLNNQDMPQLCYRLIALECCMLKMLTLIIDRRIREGAADIGAIPSTQNGFQDGLRTNDNVFVLLCLIDKAQSENKPLYVAYLDLKNAFPGTDRSTLWVKLALLGVSGPMIE
ncbi:hypothetical protein C8R47DRAFT_990337, partial [Mycena vitilis]